MEDTQIIFEKSKNFILTEGRDLEKALFKYHFESADKALVLKELARFQNKDGGFGNAIGPDLRSPISTSISTWYAIRMLISIQCSDNEPLLVAALDYLECTFNENKKGWDIVVPEIDNYPHAPWWNYADAMAHFGWGNPSAEIFGFLVKFRGSSEIVKKLKDLPAQKILSVSPDDFHEIYCFKKLYDLADSDIKKQIQKPLISLMDKAVDKNPVNWVTYSATPLTFIDSPSDSLADVFGNNLLQENINSIIKGFKSDIDCWDPNWDWEGNYANTWPKAKVEWSAVITLNNILKLRKFNII